MTEQTIFIGKGDRLNTVLREIPSNTVLNKMVCGIGATWLEINANRHSIIIEPNVPVIEGKVQQHQQMQGVKDGVTAEDVKRYVAQRLKNQQFVKLMTTPESFPKVKKALSELGINYRRDFFMLFDECEKIVEDIGYRNTIALPIDEFFRFNNKAMVSATPIVPDDPRFEEQNFQLLKVQPNYDHRQNLTLHPTNNVYCTLSKVLSELADAKEPICIFFNSTDGIDEVIAMLGIRDQTNIYCGTESVEKLKERGYSNVTDSLLALPFNRFNFLTSRFYSAVDIIIDTQPIVILLTEVFLAAHSKIDARTDAIQIAGRFRNGVSKYIHITNYNKEARSRGRKSVEDFLLGEHAIYTEMRTKRRNTNNRGEQKILDEFLGNTLYRVFVTETGAINHFMYQNAFVEDELVGAYRFPTPIKMRYDASGAFNISWQNIYFRHSDKDRRALQGQWRSKKKLNELAMNQILTIAKAKGVVHPLDLEYLGWMQSSFPLIHEAIQIIGEKGIRKADFKTAAIRELIAKTKRAKEFLRADIVADIHKHFTQDTWYSTADINAALTAIYTKHGIVLSKKVTANYITAYFGATAKRKKSAAGWMLGKKKFVKVK